MAEGLFDLTVEGKSDDPREVAPPALRLTGLVGPPPDVIVLDESGIMLIKVGRYLTTGDNYSYRVATMARLISGRLER
jgi:hypothetical protein